MSEAQTFESHSSIAVENSPCVKLSRSFQKFTNVFWPKKLGQKLARATIGRPRIRVCTSEMVY